MRARCHPRRPIVVFNSAPVPFLPIPSIPLRLPPRYLIPRHPRQWHPVLRSMVAGAMAEMLVIGLLYPLDTLKVVVQAGGKRSWKGLWKGFRVALPWTGVDAGVFAGVLVSVRMMMERRGLRNVGDWVAGGVAAVVSHAWFSPVEVVRDRMRVGGGCWKEVVGGVMEKGVGDFWKGAGGRLLRDVPFEVMEFGGFEWGLRLVEGWKGKVGRGEVAALGALVGGVTGLLISPIEFGVTRVVCNGGGDVKTVIGNILKERGWKSVFSATKEVVLRESIASGLYFFVYDSLRNFGVSTDDNDSQG